MDIDAFCVAVERKVGPTAGAIRRYDATPAARPSASLTMAKNSGSSRAAALSAHVRRFAAEAKGP